jgi:hypothetical protein
LDTDRASRARPAATMPHGQDAAGPALGTSASCWWCGRAMDVGAVFVKFRRHGRFCCVRCARALDIPGLLLG